MIDIQVHLTTFDLEAFEKDKNLKRIPEKRVAKMIEFDRQDIMNVPNFEVEINKRFEEFVKVINSGKIPNINNTYQ